MNLQDLIQRAKNFAVNSNNSVQNTAAFLGRPGSAAVEGGRNFVNSVRQNYNQIQPTQNIRYDSNVPALAKKISDFQFSVSKSMQGARDVDYSQGIENKIGKFAMQNIANPFLNVPSQLLRTIGNAGQISSLNQVNTSNLLKIGGQAANIGLNAGSFIGGGGTAKNIIKTGFASKLPQLGQVIYQGAKTGAKFGGGFGAAYGASQGIQEGNDLPTQFKNMVVQAGLQGLFGMGVGAVFGGGMAGTAHGASNIMADTALLLRPKINKTTKANVFDGSYTLPELENKLHEVNKINYGNQYNPLEVKQWAQELFNKAPKFIEKTEEAFKPKSLLFKGAQRMKEAGVRPGLSLKTVGGGKKTNPLIQEARKGIKVYHGSAKENIDALKNGIKIYTPEEKLKFPSTGGGNVGISMTTDKATAHNYSAAFGNKEVGEFTLNPNAKIKRISTYIDDTYTPAQLEKLQKQGYDAIISGAEEKEVRILSEKAIQSQPLQEGDNPLIQEARKTPVYEGKIKGEYGSVRGGDKIQVGNLNDSTTILHEVLHKNYGKLSQEEQGALDYAFNQFNEKYPGAFSTIYGGPEENLARAIEDYPVLRKKFGGDFNKKLSEGDNGKILVDFFKKNIDETANNIERISVKDRLSKIKSQSLQEGVKTGQLSNQSVPQAEGLKTTPKPPVESTPKTELSQDVRQLDSSKPSSYINTTTTDSKLLQTLNKALKEAKPVRGQQDALYAKARGQKMAIMMKARGKMAGEKGFFSEKGALAGSLPKVEYETIRKNFTQESVDRLFNMVKESKNIDEWDKIAAQEGLAKLLGESGMGVPTRNEIATMHKVFGQEFTETLLSKRPLLEKMKEMGMQIYNLPRSMMAGMGDFSATLMQNALFAYRHPVMTTKNFGQSLKYFGSDKFFKASMQEIGQRPNYELMKQAKVSFTDVSPIVTQREEEFMSSLAEKIPGIGRVIKASGRAYTGFLNKMRADVADSLIETKKLMGDELDERFLRSMGEFVNMGTGRGSLGKLEKSASVLSQGMFSARKLMATFNTLNPAFYVKADPLIRKEALKTMGAFFGGATTITGLAKLAGADVSTDPTNSDFGKIKIGNTRVNLFGTYQQLVVLFARQLKGYATSSTSGQRMTLGEGYKPLNRLELFGRFFESKEHPTLSLITGAMEGQNAVGEDFDAATEGLRRIMPMIASDSYDLYNEHGAKGLLGIIPAMLGVFTQTYGKQIPTVEKTDSGKPTIKLKNTPDLSQTIVNKIRGTEMSNIPESQRASIVEQKNKESKLDYEKAQIKKGNVDDADLTDPEIKKYLKKTEMDKTKEEFINSDKSSMKVEGGYLRKSENGETATFISDSKYNSQLATQRMERAKKNDDLKTWAKYAEQKYVNLQKQLNDPNTDQLEKETIQNDIEDLENQYAKYAGYSGFTKPKKGKTVKLNLKKIEGFDMPKISSSSIKISAPKKLNLKKLKIEKKKVKIKFNKTQAPSASKRLV